MYSKFQEPSQCEILTTESRYTHVTTNCKMSQKPVETGGGILSDEMGLGKTLTMLAAMIHSAEDARAFAMKTYHGMSLGTEHALITSRATLVIIPSPRKSRIRSKCGSNLIECSTSQRVDGGDQIVS
jgi:SNF2 family DNA or RNA helicase